MNLFFDLDGTLTDPGVGITLCLVHALAKMGHAAPPPSSLNRFIGPPLRGTFAELLETSDEAAVAEAIRHYRDRFVAIGMFENYVYPDVPAGLDTLSRAGHRLWVVTAKPTVFARKIVEHFGLASRFQGVHGSGLDGKHTDKAELIRHALSTEGVSAADTWVIGDRAQDIAGARSNDAGAIGVLWGYGSTDELRAAGPDHLVGSMAALIDAVAAGRPASGLYTPAPLQQRA